MNLGRDKGLVVGVADLLVGAAGDLQLLTYALGSCIGLTAYDPVAQVGGLLHFMLPQPSPDSPPDLIKPAMYASTGIPLLFDTVQARGGNPARFVIVAAGAAEILGGVANMAIGKRNHAMLRKVLWKTDTKLDAEDILSLIHI